MISAAVKKYPLDLNPFQEQDVDHFMNALDAAVVKEEPYQHFLLSNLCHPQLIDGLLDIPFDPIDLDYSVGSREEFNPVRRYLNPEIIETYPAARRISDIFLSMDIIGKFEDMGGIALKDSLLRIEYAIDTDKFWLQPHTDIGAKLFTMLMYLSKDANSEEWGTDIYSDADTHHSTAPYHSNSAMMFFPADNTWHGFEPRTIQGVRKSLIINYVKPEWRNRHELVHPMDPIY